jgi:CRP-like cAMP-binding protein
MNTCFQSSLHFSMLQPGYMESEWQGADETKQTSQKSIRPDQSLLQMSNLLLDRSSSIYHEGMLGENVYSISSGLVKLEMVLPSGDQKIVGLLSRGDVIGLESLIKMPYRHSATTLNQCELCKIPGTLINDLRKQSLTLNQDLITRWDTANRLAYEWLIKMNTGTAHERVMHLIDYLVENSDSAPEFHLPSRDDMSSMMNLTRETVSRVIAQLKREGEITFYGNNIYERQGNNSNMKR